VPPIFQPELAARAVVWAADHRRREWWVGASTVATLVANAVAPGLLDRYLARTGYDSQQTEDDAAPDRPNNLWDPADDARDWGAHGDFDDRSHGRSAQWALSRYRGRRSSPQAPGSPRPPARRGGEPPAGDRHDTVRFE
jgi:hypothetical protein